MKQIYRALKNWRVLAVSLLAIAAFVGLATLFDVDRPPKEIHGTANLTDRQLQALSDQEKYQSLDLRVAKLAIYKGARLQVIKDLGVSNNVDSQIIRFPVYSAGLSEYGLLTKPTTAPPADGYPIVILLHGYINPARYSTPKAYLQQMEFFSQHGFAVVKPDLRGQGLSIEAGRPEGAYFSMAYNVDTLSLIASIKETGYLNKDKINLWGHSMGAYIGFRAAVLSPDIKNVILLAGPVDDLKDMYSTYVPPSDRANPVAELIKNTDFSKYGTPDSNPAFWNNASPFNFLSGTDAEFQIHVGGKDRVVPPEFSADLNNALIKAGKKHQYYYYPDGDHGLGAEMPTILQRSLQLLQAKN